jgi:hypothetical protein
MESDREDDNWKKQKQMVEQKIMNIRSKRIRDIICGNCGEKGHVYKRCTKPITSYGIMAFRRDPIDSKEHGPIEVMNWEPPPGFDTVVVNKRKKRVRSISPKDREKEPWRLLMVQRKDTMGYVDFIRGRYPDQTVNFELHKKRLNILFQEMIPLERKKLTV